MRVILAALAATTVLVGCSSGDDVDWSQFSPSVRATIDQAAKDRDCDTLQDQFDTADANNSPEAANLMGYIDGKMKAAGCYGSG